VHRAVKGALLGAAVSGAVTALQMVLQPPPPIPDTGVNGQGTPPGSGGARQVALRAVEGALAGAAVAFVIDSRSRRRAAALAVAALDRVNDATADALERVEPFVDLAVEMALGAAADLARAAESGARQLVSTSR
jgi:hypothetical protein